MISIIICSRTKELSQSCQLNIRETIGVAHEIIVIDNSGNKYDIFQAYNAGVQKSNFPFLCFMHDDIVYHTKNWGLNVIRHFADETTGAIGIAGTPYMPVMPGSWWCNDMVNISILSDGQQPEHPSIHKYPPTAGNKNKVVVLDGVWFCVRRQLFYNIRFDEINYTGFHFYDADISMQVMRAGYNLFCVFDIVIEHRSKGALNKNWLQNALAFNKKWLPVLPAACIPLKYAERCEAELRTLQEFVSMMILNEVPKRKAFRSAFFKLLKFPQIYFHIKTPVHLSKYLFNSFK